MFPRRRFVKGMSGLGMVAAQAVAPGWVRAVSGLSEPLLAEASGEKLFNIDIARAPVRVDGKDAIGIAINGEFPGPLLRWREGDHIALRVHNSLDQSTSIHWHGILLPFQMDGVPGVTFPGIAPGETFNYRFPIKQTGTYWYHSHSGLQEPLGHYGPIVIDPAAASLPVSGCGIEICSTSLTLAWADGIA